MPVIIKYGAHELFIYFDFLSTEWESMQERAKKNSPGKNLTDETEIGGVGGGGGRAGEK